MCILSFVVFSSETIFQLPQVSFVAVLNLSKPSIYTSGWARYSTLVSINFIFWKLVFTHTNFYVIFSITWYQSTLLSEFMPLVKFIPVNKDVDLWKLIVPTTTIISFFFLFNYIYNPFFLLFAITKSKKAIVANPISVPKVVLCCALYQCTSWVS